MLKKCYLDDKMSTTEISKKSEEIFGVYVGTSTVYKELVRYEVPLRDKSISVSRAKSTLDIDKTYVDEKMIEWIDGFLLGDGGVTFKNITNFMGARFQIGSSCEEWSRFASSKFEIYGVSSPKVRGKIDERHPHKIWHSQTKTHPDIVVQAKRWYGSNGDWKKQVPDDVRITPTSILLWYLGNGSFTYVQDGNISILRLHTCAFTPEIINGLLIPKLEALGLRCKHEKSKNDIRVCADSIRQFFNIIGHKSPISCYDYKFDIPEWLKLIRLSHIVKDEKERYRAQYYYKMGQIECSKSPGGEMLLFTEAQAEALRKKLD
jgi:hypothetical protein